MMLENRTLNHSQSNIDDGRTYLDAFQFTSDCKYALTIRLNGLLAAISLHYEVLLLPSFLSKFAMGNAKIFFIPPVLFGGASHRVDLAAAEVVGHFRVIVVRRGRLLKSGELLRLRVVHSGEGGERIGVWKEGWGREWEGLRHDVRIELN